MAHELDIKADGTGAMFSVGETPWHREGVVLSQAPRSVDEALDLAGLNWEVQLRPAFFEVADDEYVEVEDAKVVTRTDRGKALGVVGRFYQPLQNRDAFRILQPLVDNGMASFETAGSLRGGRDVWTLVRFNIDSPIVREVFADEVVPFGTIMNNHAGERQVVIMETPIRIVCRNTLGFALQGFKGQAAKGKAVKVRHTLNVEARTTEAATAMWAGIVERYEAIARQYKLLKATYLDEAMFRKLVLDVVAPLPEAGTDSELAKALIKSRTEKAEKRRAELSRLWIEGKGHQGDHSAWEAYNAVAEAADHDEAGLVFAPVKGSRVQSLIEGRLGDAKDAVLNGLVDFASA